MARKRMIDPSFWEDCDLGELPATARLLFIAMFSNADDEGRILADVRHLKRTAFAYDETTADEIERALDQLASTCSNLEFYEANGRRYAAFLKWREYQYIQKPHPSKLPAPPSAEASRTKGEPVTDEEQTGLPAKPEASDKAPLALSEPYDTGTIPVSDESHLVERNRREEKNGVTDVTPSDADAPPRLSVVGGNGNGKVSARKKKPETAEEAELREMQKSLQAKLGRYPFSKNNAKFLTRYREHGPEAIERAVEEWRERTRDADRFDDMAVLKAIDSALRVSRPKTADPGF
jgi:hypothetical protein